MIPVITELKASYNIQKVGMHGFCYGGGVAVIASLHPNLLNGAVICHPGKGFSIPQDIEKVISKKNPK